jgi:hypothetical protein
VDRVLSPTPTASEPSADVQASRFPWKPLLAYGLAVAIVGTLLIIVSTPGQWLLMGTRAEGYEASIEMLEDGGPPLLGYAGSVNVGTGNDKYVALGATDHQGTYVVLPLVGHLLGLEDPRAAMEVVFLIAVFLTLLFYPVVFYALFRSWGAALLAPLMLLAGARILNGQDIYWVPALAAFALLPPLLLVDRRWPRRSFPIMLGVLAVASVASSFRSNAGLGIAIAAGIVVLARPWSLPRKGLAVAALVAAYLSFSVLGMTAIREYRDSWVGDPRFAEQASSAHPVWHTAYIGLGYLPNDYGLRYRDEDAIATVELIEPGTEYVSEEYESILRERYLDVATENPDFFLSVTAQKVLVTIGNAAPLLVLLALLVPVAIAARRRQAARWLLLMVPAALLASIQPIFAVPFRVYETGLYGALGVGVVVLLAWLVAEVEQRLRIRAQVEGRPFRETVHLRAGLDAYRDLRSPGSRRSLHAGLAVAAVAVLIFVVRMPIVDRAMEWQAGAPPGAESAVSLEER